MANEANLKPFKSGQSGNPHGRPKGIPNRKTILSYLLFEADIDDLGVLKTKPTWFNNVKPKVIYSMMTMAMAIRAMNGDVAAFNALNKAIGDNGASANDLEDVVHIFVPEKLNTIEGLNAEGAKMRNRLTESVLMN